MGYSTGFKGTIFNRACIRFNDSFSLLDINWSLKPGQVWAIMGASGSGKSALAAALTGAGELKSGTLEGVVANAGMVSLESQAALIERERLRDDSDISDKISQGTPAGEMLYEVSKDPELLAKLIRMFRLEPLLDRGFRRLSSGETRKLLFTRALTSKPDMLIVDGPFEGLDAQTVPLVSGILEQVSCAIPLLLVINRFDELPDFVTHVALIEKGRLKTTAETRDKPAMDLISQLLHLKTTDLEIPRACPGESSPPLNPGEPLVNIRDASVRYTDNLVFEHLDWRIEAGQHWQLTGPNGSGKTSLLNLVTGDHPQCYNNDIFVLDTSAAMVKASGISSSISVTCHPRCIGITASASIVKTSLFQGFTTASACIRRPLTASRKLQCSGCEYWDSRSEYDSPSISSPTATSVYC